MNPPKRCQKLTLTQGCTNMPMLCAGLGKVKSLWGSKRTDILIQIYCKGYQLKKRVNLIGIYFKCLESSSSAPLCPQIYVLCGCYQLETLAVIIFVFQLFCCFSFSRLSVVVILVQQVLRLLFSAEEATVVVVFCPVAITIVAVVFCCFWFSGCYCCYCCFCIIRCY